jgi:hypothetical protein
MKEGFRDFGKNEEPCGKTAGYLNARSNLHYIRSLARSKLRGMRSLSVSRPVVFLVRG